MPTTIPAIFFQDPRFSENHPVPPRLKFTRWGGDFAPTFWVTLDGEGKTSPEMKLTDEDAEKLIIWLASQMFEEPHVLVPVVAIDALDTWLERTGPWSEGAVEVFEPILRCRPPKPVDPRVEKVAKAMYDAQPQNLTWEHARTEHLEQYLTLARAAVEAMDA